MTLKQHLSRRPKAKKASKKAEFVQLTPRLNLHLKSEIEPKAE
jgi:hypothetical protein